MTRWWRVLEQSGRFFVETRLPYTEWDRGVSTLGFSERIDAEELVKGYILSGDGEWWEAPNALTQDEADSLTAKFAGRDIELSDDTHNEREYIDPKLLEFALYLKEHGRISEEID